MSWTWGLIYLLMWMYRSAYSVLGQTVIAGFTQLGDSQSYQNANFSVLSVSGAGALNAPRIVATWLTEMVGATLSLLSAGNPMAINIGFQTIALFGIVTLLNSLSGTTRIVVALMLLLPSFSVWSSVAGKEPIVVFAVGVIGALIVRIYQGRAHIGLLQVSALVIIYLFKNHYLPALFFILFGTFVAKRVQQKAFIVLLGGLASLSLLFVFEEQLAALAFEVAKNFAVDGSTRGAFWDSSGDVLRRAPLGMLLAFYGPTFSETGGNILRLASFVESALLFGVLFWLVLRKLPRLPVYLVLMVGFTVFWILFAAYPFGIMNPGSAIRYRTGYEILVIVTIAALLTPDVYRSWVSSHHRTAS